MEYALWEISVNTEFDSVKGLNPCFNGICSLRIMETIDFDLYECLNPCFNGICSLSLHLNLIIIV